jgi:dihydrofolate synthase/folylpolyglutamate synthase
MVALVDELRPKIAGIDALTTFELTTALGFMWFARREVQAAVVEVGLGGRLDATNVIDPVVSVITTLSYDHTNVLGNTLAQIAGEKAGIIKPGRPVVSAPQRPEALEVIQKTAGERNSSLTLVGQDILFGPLAHSLDGQSLFVWTANQQAEVNEFIESGGECGWHPVQLSIPLLGYHQVENAATAYAALTAARRHGLSISDEAIERGFVGVQWPGRFEVLRRDPPIIVDSAHNGDSALKLRIALDDYFPGKPVVLIFGVSEDKDVRAILSALLPRVRQVVATQSIHPRAMSADKIVAMVHQFGLPAKAVLPLEDALEFALGEAGDGAAVVATGSLFIAAAIRSVWNADQADTESSQTHGERQG